VWNDFTALLDDLACCLNRQKHRRTGGQLRVVRSNREKCGKSESVLCRRIIIVIVPFPLPGKMFHCLESICTSIHGGTGYYRQVNTSPSLAVRQQSLPQIPLRTSIALTLLKLVEEVDVIEHGALVAARELSVRAIDQLQTILLVELTPFVVVTGDYCQRWHIIENRYRAVAYWIVQAKAPTTLTPSSYMLLSISRRKDW